MTIIFAKKMAHRIFSSLLIFCVIFSLCMPSVAFAAEPSILEAFCNDTRTVITVRMNDTIIADESLMASELLLSCGGREASRLPEGSLVSLHENTIKIQLPMRLKEKKNQIIIPRGTIYGQRETLYSPNIDVSGTVERPSQISEEINTNQKLFSPDTGVSLSDDKQTVTFQFTERIYNNMVSIASFKEMIRVAYDGGKFEMLDADCMVNIRNEGSIEIRFSKALNNPTARVKILAGAIQNAEGNTVTEEIITDPLGYHKDMTKVFLNGKQIYVSLTTENIMSDGKKMYTANIDSEKTTSELKAICGKAALSIHMPDILNGGVISLNGLIVEQLIEKNAKLTVTCGGISQVFCARDLQLQQALQSLKKASSDLSKLTLEIGIAYVEKPYTADLASKAEACTLTVLTQPIELTLIYKTGDNRYAITKYPRYIQQYFSVGENQAQNQNLTVVRIETSGKVNPVPSKIKQKDGNYYLEANLCNNGVYAVISAERIFSDTPNWAMHSVHTLASRMILQDAHGKPFRANAPVSRAEVAEMITRALGLLTDKSGVSKFFDVTLTDWYFASVSIAVEQDFIRGYGDNTFRPEQNITRQEVMSILARVMRFLEGEPVGSHLKLNEKEVKQILSKFTDAKQISNWAQFDVAECVQAKVVKGDNFNCLHPNANLTRTEMAQLIYNLLVQYDMISAE